MGVCFGEIATHGGAMSRREQIEAKIEVNTPFDKEEWIKLKAELRALWRVLDAAEQCWWEDHRLAPLHSTLDTYKQGGEG